MMPFPVLWAKIGEWRTVLPSLRVVTAPAANEELGISLELRGKLLTQSPGGAFLRTTGLTESAWGHTPCFIS